MVLGCSVASAQEARAPVQAQSDASSTADSEPAEQPSPKDAVAPLKTWRVGIGVSAPFAFAPQSFTAAPSLSGTVYFQPLVDDPNTPLGLLGFLQHPSLVTVVAAKTVTGYSGSADLSVYPWSGQGLEAFARVEDDPTPGRILASGLLVAQLYPAPTTRVFVGYSGSRAYDSVQTFEFDSFEGGAQTLVGCGSDTAQRAGFS